VALINALGVVIVAVIHAFRVPYRESAVKEAVAANEAGLTASPGWVNNDPTAHTRTDAASHLGANGGAFKTRECPERSPLGDWRCHCERTHISRSHPSTARQR